MFVHQRRHDSVDAVLNFCVGQRAIERLKRQTHRDADRSVGHAFSLISIEERDRDERRRPAVSGRLNGATNNFGRQGARDDDRQIAHDERKSRQ